jgi:hypothetical protein
MQQANSRKKIKERRKHPRFDTKDVAFAILKADREEELGQIVNISMGGLVFHYFIGNREFQKADRLDVLLADRGIHVEDIKFRVVEDFELVNELPFSSITKREQRVLFNELSDSQKLGIDSFIRRHTLNI